MKNLVILTGFIFAFAIAATAQVEVEAVMQQDQFLPNESVPVHVRIINTSGQTLHFDDSDWLSYSVEARDGSIVEKGSNTKAPHGFEIKTGDVATTKGDLAPTFQLTSVGRYSLIATVSIKEWNKTINSKPVFFDVVRGNKYWEQEFGVPQSTNAGSAPEVRKYILSEATMNNHLTLYVRLTDALEGRSLAIHALGTMISFSNPRARLDSANNLHVIYQESSRQYRYTVINTDGKVIQRNTYGYTDSAPYMKTLEDGQIVLVGGVKLVADNDLPPNAAPKLIDDVNKTPQAKTSR